MPFELVMDSRALKAMSMVVAVAGGVSFTARHPGRAPAAPPAPSPIATPNPYGAPVFEDAFDGDHLDTQRWSDALPSGRRTRDNGERQFYSPDSVTVGGGVLTLHAQRRSMGGMEFTSGMVSSFGHFAQRYGRFEMRAKFPKGQGLWPAFWLVPANRSWPPQVDIVTMSGAQTTAALFRNHFVGGGKHRWQTIRRAMPDGSADFHTYTLDWRPDRLSWRVDGIEVACVTESVPDQPMYLVASLAVGGDEAGAPLSARAEIDYIRVWAL